MRICSKNKYLPMECNLNIPIMHDTYSQHSRIYYILDRMAKALC
uniref:Uncharacterized protein n=1 Tax=CrAss-like virus sp. ctjK323 TaxID=2825839 RepID=A0A8S5Q0W7_9CAUD|nr:MAG TPA: hypothetical protein [CrAss-like virus sp. ctjK323]